MENNANPSSSQNYNQFPYYYPPPAYSSDPNRPLHTNSYPAYVYPPPQPPTTTPFSPTLAYPPPQLANSGTLNYNYSMNYGDSAPYPSYYSPPHAPQGGPYPQSKVDSLPHLHHQSSYSSATESWYGYSGEESPGSFPPAYPPLEESFSSLRLNSNSNFSYPNSEYTYLERRDSSNAQNLQIQATNSNSLRVRLLHGNLEIWVFEARNLPNMDMFHKTIGDVLKATKISGIIANKMEDHMNMKITSDPYVSVSVSRAVLGRTFVISNSENPVWMQHFNVPVAHYASEVHFNVKDSDVVGAQLIGVVSIPVEQIYFGAKIEGTFPVLNNGKPCKPGATLRLSIQYTPIEGYQLYRQPNGISGTYFPLRKGGRVKLYQDAHVMDGSLPSVKLDGGASYVQGQCWQDIFDAIIGASCLIYIAGWSVWDKVALVRDERNSSITLGDLLMRKSQEAVRVLLLVWDDPTSRNILGYKTNGVMATHDEDTRRFFKHSSVRVLLCPRIGGKRHSWAKQREVETIYTHHQKTVIVDADAGNGKRKIVAFVGGLDLCNGRYDTPEHSLFRTLQTVHKDDNHNPTYTNAVAGGPREPWHDMHSKIDGPAAYDVLANFEDRWLKTFKLSGVKKLKGSKDDSLVDIGRIQSILGVHDFPDNENDIENWHVQIFRSIDSSSVNDFPKDPREATRKNLSCGKNVLIDDSMHTAYVNAIRAAKHFIYIENQYFIGSSYNWRTNNDTGANNLIPMEIALKIAEKIRAKERFAVYIVIPMWPEGNPTAPATQRILYWQNKTMEMMYREIYKALVEVNLENIFSPQDYLNFFCLGNREAGIHAGSPSSASLTTPQALGQRNGRFMIYVHSKGMIVDDEYVIIGSANINQRSMAGTRDSEIAMGGYQPHHTWARKQGSPRGQIYGYRMSLWAEHIGGMESCFEHPKSIDCVRKVRTIGEINWKQYVAPEVTEMRGHLLAYPVTVDRQGKLKPLPGSETFPDVGGNIFGSFLAINENLTT